MSVLRVQQLMNEAGTGPVELTNGATFGLESATLTEEQLTISTTGIATVTTLIANNINTNQKHIIYKHALYIARFPWCFCRCHCNTLRW